MFHFLTYDLVNEGLTDKSGSQSKGELKDKLRCSFEECFKEAKGQGFSFDLGDQWAVYWKLSLHASQRHEEADIPENIIGTKLDEYSLRFVFSPFVFVLTKYSFKNEYENHLTIRIRVENNR